MTPSNNCSYNAREYYNTNINHSDTKWKDCAIIQLTRICIVLKISKLIYNLLCRWTCIRFLLLSVEWVKTGFNCFFDCPYGNKPIVWYRCFLCSSKTESLKTLLIMELELQRNRCAVFHKCLFSVRFQSSFDK